VLLLEAVAVLSLTLGILLLGTIGPAAVSADPEWGREASAAAKEEDRAQKSAESETAKDQDAKSSEDPIRIHPTTVVVIGTRTETELEKSPVAASAIDRDELKLRNVQLIDQSVNLLPGVYAFRNKGPQDTGSGIGMRGFNGRGTDGARVLVLLDGQPINSAYDGSVQWTTFPADEVDRIEVVRGPYSSLYGGNAMGGAINILTRPVERRQMELTAQYGAQDSVTYSATYSDRWWNRLGFRIGYQRTQNGGYSVLGVYSSASSASTITGPLVVGAIPLLSTTGSTRYAIGEQGDNWYNQHAWWARGEYALGQKTSISFQTMHRNYRYGYDAYQSLLTDASGNSVDRGKVFFYSGSLRTMTLSPGNFIGGPGGGSSDLINAQILHAFTTRSQLRLTAGAAIVPEDWYSTPASTATLGSGSGTTADRPNRTWSGEIQWSWLKSSRHNLVFGSGMRRNSSSSAEFDLSDYASRDTRLRQTAGSSGKDFSQAIFAQDQLTVSQKLQWVIGGRYDRGSNSEGTAVLYYGANPIFYPSREANSFSAKLSALYQAPAGWILRTSVGNSFRNPTVYELFRSWRSSSGLLYLSNPDLKTERLASWEVGLRKKFGDRFDLDAGYFENHMHNLIYRSTDLQQDPSGQTRIFQNAGQGRTRGVEIAVQERPFSWLQLRESYT
jgi:iron complex outermembrane receptor protein